MTTVDTKKVMFEIYKEGTAEGAYRVVYFTELGEHDKEEEIGSAMRGEHIYDGYILHRARREAKEAIARLLERLNGGESLTANQISQELETYAL